ncbi:MAG: hypothetical protein ACI83O_000340 [Patescibacteria group bacterium]|jgi:hypothetical protein
MTVIYSKSDHNRGTIIQETYFEGSKIANNNIKVATLAYSLTSDFHDPDHSRFLTLKESTKDASLEETVLN